MHMTHAASASSDADSVAREMAVLGQMLLNGGAYGTMRFFSKQMFAKTMPVNLSELIGKKTEQSWGIGCVWMNEEELGKGTVGHAAAGKATLRISRKLDLVISMTRNRAGENFGKYHGEFIQAVVDNIAEAE
jgi:CubicO group peptidase (beta-lactamase class C family)